MSDHSKVLLTLDDGDIIVAKRFGYVDGGLMGIHAECDDGTFKLFAVKSNPTNTEFHEIEVPADASYEEKKKAVEDATGWESDDEFPWLDTDKMAMRSQERIRLSESTTGWVRRLNWKWWNIGDCEKRGNMRPDLP